MIEKNLGICSVCGSMAIVYKGRCNSCGHWGTVNDQYKHEKKSVISHPLRPCIVCHEPTFSLICGKCVTARRKAGYMQSCSVCTKLMSCPVKNPSKKEFKCPECGEMDYCSHVRNGLCLKCYAKHYCEEFDREHPEY